MGNKYHFNNMIHVVDDEKSIRRALVILAKSANLAIDDFGSAADFLNFENKKNDDILILDIHMPGMNGFELLEELKKRNIHLNTIILTAYDNAENRGLAQKYGVKAFFSKPCDSKALIDTLNYLSMTQKYS